MKAELSKNNRIKRDLNYEALRAIEDKIAERIRAEHADEVDAIRNENKRLYQEDKDFIERAKDVLEAITPGTLLKVKTQVGKGSQIIQEYIGQVQKKFNRFDGMFIFISPTDYDGKPFAIGFSCLLSIEVVNLNAFK